MAKIVNSSKFVSESGEVIYEKSLKRTLVKDGVTYTRQLKPKHKSRGTRLSEALVSIQNIIDELDAIISDEFSENDLESVKEGANNCLANLDFGAIDELRSEMTDWRDNLDSANLTHLPKYDEVSECCDALDSVMDTFESVDTEVSGDSIAEIQDALNSIKEDLENAVSEGEDVSFPGMY